MTFDVQTVIETLIGAIADHKKRIETLEFENGKQRRQLAVLAEKVQTLSPQEHREG